MHVLSDANGLLALRAFVTGAVLGPDRELIEEVAYRGGHGVTASAGAWGGVSGARDEEGGKERVGDCGSPGETHETGPLEGHDRFVVFVPARPGDPPEPREPFCPIGG
jgi:hypothetical protein